MTMAKEAATPHLSRLFFTCALKKRLPPPGSAFPARRRCPKCELTCLGLGFFCTFLSSSLFVNGYLFSVTPCIHFSKAWVQCPSRRRFFRFFVFHATPPASPPLRTSFLFADAHKKPPPPPFHILLFYQFHRLR